MPRPQFTKTEEKMIDDVRNPSHGPLYIWTHYFLWIVTCVLLCALGLLNGKTYPQILGFAIVLYLLIQFIAYQCNPAWRIILGKYEEALKDGGQPPSAGDVATRAAPEKCRSRRAARRERQSCPAMPGPPTGRSRGAPEKK